MATVHIVHAGEAPPGSWYAAVFVAGPSPRTDDVASWRPHAEALLRQRWQGPGDLVVFVPEARGYTLDALNNPGQIAWEEAALRWSDQILFWVPRDLDELPGLTTNVEFGRWEASGRCVLGAPPDAVEVDYLRHYAHRHHVPVVDSLDEAVDAVVGALRHGAVRSGGERAGGERQVPLELWRTASFQHWYQRQRRSDRRLDAADVLWRYPSGHGPRTGTLWAVEATLWIPAERRHKQEVVVGGPQRAVIAAYRPGPTLLDTPLLLVREQRVPATTADGYVTELPGGATHLPGLTPTEVALAEFVEETGLAIAADRLSWRGSAPQAATLLCHDVHLFTVELTEAEVAQVTADHGPYGTAAETERTWPYMTTLRQLEAGQVDWTTIGLLWQALTQTNTPVHAPGPTRAGQP